MSKELILENLKATIELLEKTQDECYISENEAMYSFLAQQIKKLENTAVMPYLLNQVVMFVILLCQKKKLVFQSTDQLYLKVAVGSEYDDNGYSLGIAGESCSVKFTSATKGEELDKLTDAVEDNSWDWIYSLDHSSLKPWLKHGEEGVFVLKISNISAFYEKIKAAGGSVLKKEFYEHVTVEV